MAKTGVGSEAWSARIRTRAKKLAHTLEVGYMDLAKLLFTVFDVPVDGDPDRGPVYLSWGYSSFGEYVERELNIHRRKAERLRRIWYRLQVELEDMDERLRRRIVDLGWSKARELVRVINLENAAKWVETAEGMNYHELEAAVKTALLAAQGEDGEPVDEADPPSETEKVKVINFPVFPEQRDTVDQALERASQLSSSNKKGHNLTLICMDFLANNDFKLANDPEARFRYVAKIEELMGMRLVMIDPHDEHKVIYGLEALREAAKFRTGEEEDE